MEDLVVMLLLPSVQAEAGVWIDGKM